MIVFSTVESVTFKDLYYFCIKAILIWGQGVFMGKQNINSTQAFSVQISIEITIGISIELILDNSIEFCMKFYGM